MYSDEDAAKRKKCQVYAGNDYNYKLVETIMRVLHTDGGNESVLSQCDSIGREHDERSLRNRAVGHIRANCMELREDHGGRRGVIAT